MLWNTFIASSKPCNCTKIFYIGWTDTKDRDFNQNISQPRYDKSEVLNHKENWLGIINQYPSNFYLNKNIENFDGSLYNQNNGNRINFAQEDLIYLTDVSIL